MKPLNLSEQMTAQSQLPTVVVYGGTGFFGKLLVDDLLVRTTARLVVASRNLPRRPSADPRLTFIASDLNDPASARAVLAGASIVVNCAGPYQSQGSALLQAAIANGVHYIDLAEERSIVSAARKSHDPASNAGIALLSGLSVVPGLAALLAASALKDFDEMLAVRTFVAPGTRGSRGVATVRALLSGMGRPLSLLREGREIVLRGWSEPEWIEFPRPIGSRLQYLALDSADHDVLAREFGVRRIEFKAGSEFSWLNQALSVASRCRALTGFPPLDRWANVLRVCLKQLGRFGTDAGGVLVEGMGKKDGRTVSRQIALVADERGERIPVLLAAIAVAALLRGDLAARGAVPLSSWLTDQQLFAELRNRGFRLWSKSNLDASWQPLLDKMEPVK